MDIYDSCFVVRRKRNIHRTIGKSYMIGQMGQPKQTHKTALIILVAQRILKLLKTGPFPEGENKVSVLHVIILESKGQQTLFPD